MMGKHIYTKEQKRAAINKAKDFGVIKCSCNNCSIIVKYKNGYYSVYCPNCKKVGGFSKSLLKSVNRWNDEIKLNELRIFQAKLSNVLGG